MTCVGSEWGNPAALHGEARPGHGNAFFRFYIGFRQLRQIDFAEGGKGGHLRHRIGRGKNAGDNQEDNKARSGDDPSRR